MNRAGLLYRLNLAVALLGAGALAIAATAAVTRLRLQLPSSSDIAAACRSAVPFQSGLALALVLVVGILALAVIAFGLRSLGRQLSEQSRCRRALRPLRTVELGGAEVTLIAGSSPRALCAGLLRPRIYISESAVKQLTPDELQAVVAHERHHQRRRDPLRIFIGRLLGETLFFLPGLRGLTIRYRELAEVAADDAARESADSGSLASALLAFGESHDEPSGSVAIAPERVDNLMGRPLQLRPPVASILRSFGVVGALALAAAILASAAQQGSLSTAAALAESCMLGMFLAPVAALGLTASALRRRFR